MTATTLPKGYKQTEIGVFPEDWAIKTLGEIGEVTGAGVDKKSNPDEQPVRLVNYVDVYNRRPITSNLLSHWVTAPANKANRCSVRKGDVFFTPTSEVREDIAVSSMALEDIPDAVYSYHLVRLRCNDEVEVAYRAHAFSAKYFLDQASVLADGSGTRYVVNLPNFRRMLVALPPRDEQRRIGTLLTDVETQIATLSKLINKKTNIKQGAMQALLTGKIRLPGFSGEWETRCLGEISEINSENLSSITDQEYTFTYISLENISHGTLTDSSSMVFKNAPSRARRVVRKNDVLISTVRPNLMSHYYVDHDVNDLICSTGFSVLRSHEKFLHGPYVYHHMMASVLNNQIELLLIGSNYPAINSKDVEDLEIPVPSFDEQKAIAKALSDMDAEISALEERLEKAKAIKQGILQELLTGKIRMVGPELDMR